MIQDKILNFHSRWCAYISDHLVGCTRSSILHPIPANQNGGLRSFTADLSPSSLRIQYQSAHSLTLEMRSSTVLPLFSVVGLIAASPLTARHEAVSNSTCTSLNQRKAWSVEFTSHFLCLNLGPCRLRDQTDDLIIPPGTLSPTMRNSSTWTPSNA